MPFHDAAARTRRIVGALGDEGISFYPVRAASIGAYLGGGGVGQSIAGAVEQKPALGDGINNIEMVLRTDVDTAAEFEARSCSIEFSGRRYDIVTIDPDGPGGVECRLQEMQF